MCAWEDSLFLILSNTHVSSSKLTRYARTAQGYFSYATLALFSNIDYANSLRLALFEHLSVTTFIVIRIIAMSYPIAQTTDASDALNLKVSGIVQLKPQGADSNYLNWSFVVLLHIKSLKLSFILEPEDTSTTTKKKSQPSSWANDSISVSSFIA
ncbi:hypothetical protein PGTUg99_030175 [Puccinia graminis f. sp. tritici]|uniref:Uncharacterized protein n=1 Tax=Puccinia graminis f. sp. tritici TaxID=56615 RepID=A0A5B0S301_PUCGR|nr:hypothetical protein PGTUg99_030175 [Puccinia graminis f. sp. tritici]